MAEYIERKVAINRIKEYAADVYDIDLDDAKQFGGNSRAENYCEGLYEATELVDDIPAADVAPVVRCRDCKFAYINSFSAASGIALCTSSGQPMQQDDFCSYGERKEGTEC